MEGDSATDETPTTTDFPATGYIKLRSESIAALVILPLLTICGLFGNTLVCIAVCKFRQLRIVANYFIISLAFADLLVCGIVMPLALYQDVNNGIWGLPSWLCDMWVSVDVLTATASIWNLCVISLDRYLAITRPHQYAKRRTTSTVLLAVLTTWLLAVVLSIPAFLFVGGGQDGADAGCVINAPPVFAIIGPCVSFFIPCSIILVLYWRILIAARKQIVRRRRVGPGTNSTAETSVHSTVDTVTNNPESGSQVDAENSRQRKIISVTKERKAALVLSVVVGTFICCWLPYFAVFFSFGVCPDCQISLTAFIVLTWLGWCNSILNPIIYTIFNKDFRTAFRKLLTCKSN